MNEIKKEVVQELKDFRKDYKGQPELLLLTLGIATLALIAFGLVLVAVPVAVITLSMAGVRQETKTVYVPVREVRKVSSRPSPFVSMVPSNRRKS